jgi:hypothetical protein
MIRTRKTLILLALVLPLARVSAQDEADLRREQRLHQIYKKYYKNPTPREKWEEALSGNTEQTYQIQKGDTLWDVSETFFGEPDFWPKLWSLNKEEIFNPHEIEPGDEIRFVPGTLNEPPSIAVGEKGIEEKSDDPDKKPEGETNEVAKPEIIDIDLNALDLPPPKTKAKAPITPPKSLPPWDIRKDPNRQVEMKVAPIQRQPGPSEVLLYSYIQDSHIQPLGVITEAEGGVSLAHEGQFVVIRSLGAVSGQKYTIAHEVGTLKDRNGDNSGVVVEIDGELLVQEPVNGSENLFRAQVTRAHNPIIVGQVLTPGEIQKISMVPGGTPSELHSFIIGGPFSEERHLFGPGEVLFLDSGARNGLSPGQVLSVFRVEKARSDSTEQVQNPRPIGTIRVVRTTDQFATAVVLSALEEIGVGDSTTRNLQVK